MYNFRQHVLTKIFHASVDSYPYPHLYIRDILPSKTYSHLLAHMPTNYESKEDYPGRKTDVCRDYSDQLWREFAAFVQDDRFRNGLCDKFDLEHSGRSLAYLHRDRSGFHITPHTDVASKRLSYIFYLAPDVGHAHLGTWLCTPKRDIKWSEYHKPWALFDRVKIAPYLPNSLFVWEVSHRSYHAVDVQIDDGDPMQYRHALRGFVFREDMDIPYTFAKDFSNNDPR